MTDPIQRKRAAELVAGDVCHFPDNEYQDAVVARVAFAKVTKPSHSKATVLVVLDFAEEDIRHLDPVADIRLATDAEWATAQRKQRAEETAARLESVAQEIRRLGLPVGHYAGGVSGGVLDDVAEVRQWAEAFGLKIEDSVGIPAVSGEWNGIRIHAQGPSYLPLERALDEAYAMTPALADEAIVPAQVEQPQDWYFTWGAGQTLPDGSDAENRYTIISGTHASARTEMLQRFGNTWCDQYGSRERAGVDQFRMKRVMPLAWPKRFEPDGTLRTTHDDPDDDLPPNAGSAS